MIRIELFCEFLSTSLSSCEEILKSRSFVDALLPNDFGYSTNFKGSAVCRFSQELFSLFI